MQEVDICASPGRKRSKKTSQTPRGDRYVLFIYRFDAAELHGRSIVPNLCLARRRLVNLERPISLTDKPKWAIWSPTVALQQMQAECVSYSCRQRIEDHLARLWAGKASLLASTTLLLTGQVQVLVAKGPPVLSFPDRKATGTRATKKTQTVVMDSA